MQSDHQLLSQHTRPSPASLELNQIAFRADVFSGRMPTFLYRCPNTGYRVQGFVAQDVSDNSQSYEAITCIVCQRVHLVNPATGKVVGEGK